MRPIIALPVLTLLLLSAPHATQAQRLSERIEAYKQNQARAAAQDEAGAALDAEARMNVLLDEFVVNDLRASEALRWWSQQTGVPLVVNWRGLENLGVDPDRPITLNLRSVPAWQALRIMLQQMSEFEEMIYETTPWYVRVLTKSQANRQPVLRVYDVSDLVNEIPSFNDAPQFDLASALGSDVAGGGGSAEIFSGDNEEEEGLTEAERGEGLAELIRSSIEPDTWVANGGDISSIRYFRRRLIVNAPRYIHEQIGGSVRPVRTKPYPSYTPSTRETPAKAKTLQVSGTRKSQKTSGVRD